jgi:7-carboxy-7-deazaguanine synthase
MKINLVNNGVFPIIKDENNNEISHSDTGFKVSGTIQGEGLFTGVPSLFVRVSGCNLRCCFQSSENKINLCDTFYSSWKPEKNLMEVETIENLIRNNIGNIKHLVVTGGEPFIFKKGLTELLKRISDLDLITTIETNGTLFDETLGYFIDLFSISPKLSNSDPTEEKLKTINQYLSPSLIRQHKEKRINYYVLQNMINFCNKLSKMFQLKFVVSSIKDMEEVKDILLNLTGWCEENVYLMPEGISKTDLDDKKAWLIEECIKRGFNYSQRLHIDLWGQNRSV